MAGYIPVGVIASRKEDPFPTTGEHLDLRVKPLFGKNKGQYLNPEINRSLLQNVLIGPNKVPVVQQVGGQWKWNFPITSRFGNRVAPAAGASTFHRGIDLGIGAGTPVTYKGYGTYRPDHGFGSLTTTDAQGNPYEIKFLHTKPGKAASVGDARVPAPLQLPASQETQSDNDRRVLNLFESLFNLGTDNKKESLQESLMGSLLQQALARRGNAAPTIDALSGQPNPYSQFILKPEMLDQFS